MTALVLTDVNLTRVKKALRERLPDVKSAHLTEALATALGHRTHASLLTRLSDTDDSWPDVVILDAEVFAARLKELGSPIPNSLASGHVFDQLGIPTYRLSTRDQGDLESPPSEAILLKTEGVSREGKRISLKSARSRAWRNMMVAAVNAGIEQRLFHVLPGTNRWAGYSADPRQRDHGYPYEFTFGADIPAIAHVRGISWDELSIKVALWPTADARRWIGTMNGGFLTGAAWASGWLERRAGAYLQTSTDFCCRRKYIDLVASTRVTPKGFGDRGKIHM